MPGVEVSLRYEHPQCITTSAIMQLNMWRTLILRKVCFLGTAAFPPRYFISPTYKYVKVNIKKTVQHSVSVITSNAVVALRLSCCENKYVKLLRIMRID